MPKLVGVPGEIIDGVWLEVEPLVTRCLEKVNEYRWLSEDIRELIRDGSIQLWLYTDDKAMAGIVITELSRSPRALECGLFMVAGKMIENWRECLTQLEDWALSQGCTHMATLSRPGAAKMVGYGKQMVRTTRAL